MVAGLPAPCPATTAARPRFATCSPSRGVEISEEMALGLGAGVCFYYVPLDGQSPSRFTNGRVGRLEEQFCELTGLPLALRDLRGPRRVLARPRARAVDAGQPGAAAHRPLLPRPLRQLGPLPRPRGRPRRLRRRGRLPLRHRLRRAADDAAREPRPGAPRQPPGLPARRPHAHGRPAAPSSPTRARRPRARSSATRARCSSRRSASTRACRRCAASPPRSATGPSEIEDWQWCARFGYQVIERRGTGGGNFRLMYSRFLAEAGREEAELAARRGGRRGRRSPRRCSPRARPRSPSPSSGRGSATPPRRCSTTEERLWPALAASSVDAAAAARRARSARARGTRRGRCRRRSASAGRGSSRRSRSGRRRAGRCRRCGRRPGCW